MVTIYSNIAHVQDQPIWDPEIGMHAPVHQQRSATLKVLENCLDTGCCMHQKLMQPEVTLVEKDISGGIERQWALGTHHVRR